MLSRSRSIPSAATTPLEHATVSVLLSRMGPNIRLVGRAVSDGFYIYGNVHPNDLESAADEALERMQRGESHLAVSPLCGTNLAVGGVLSGLAALDCHVGSGDRWERLPTVLTSAMLAVLAAQPVGRVAQKYLTTSPDLGRTQIVGVREGGRGKTPLHQGRDHQPIAPPAITRGRDCVAARRYPPAVRAGYHSTDMYRLQAPVAQPDRAAAF